MRTTLNVDDRIMARLKAEAARQGRTMSELFEAALRRFLDEQIEEKAGELPPLSSFRSGGALIDVADRDALYDAMEER